ncbi:uncharacterized protein LOC101242366 [Ciona intestinalis]
MSLINSRDMLPTVLVVLYINAFCSILVNSQRNGEFPLTFQPYPPVSEVTSLNKVYTTGVTISNKTNDVFNDTIFTNAATSFYRGTTNLSGFINVVIKSSVPRVNGQTVVYDVAYNYTSLNKSVGGSDATIIQTIGNATAVKIGLENDTTFSSLYTVDNSSIQFQGNSLCSFTTVCGGTYEYCTETINGVSINCFPNCYNGICLNDAWCIQGDPNTQPICSCRGSTVWWYVGDRCETLLHIWMLVLLVLFVAAVLILILIITIVRIRNLKNKKFNKPKVKGKKPFFKKKTEDIKHKLAPHTKHNSTSNHEVPRENLPRSESSGEEERPAQDETPTRDETETPPPPSARDRHDSSSSSSDSSDDNTSVHNHSQGNENVESSSDENQPVGQVAVVPTRLPSSSDSSFSSDDEPAVIENYSPSPGAGAHLYATVNKPKPKARTVAVEDPTVPKITTV